MERLTKRNEADSAYYYPKCFEKCDGIGISSKCENCELTYNVCEKLGNNEDLEEQGRLLVLPCKIGDRLYWIDEEDDDGNEGLFIKKYPKKEPVTVIAINENGKYCVQIGYENNPLEEIGTQYALLTLEDAKKMLAEMKKNESEERK